jgi:hypothetical protein
MIVSSKEILRWEVPAGVTGSEFAGSGSGCDNMQARAAHYGTCSLRSSDQ